MRIELKAGTEARKLELDGYERSGKKQVNAPLSELESLLERDDVRIKQITLHRQASTEEANVIDEYVRAGVASDYGGTIAKVGFTSSTYREKSINTDADSVLKAKEDSLEVYQDFRKVLLDGPVTEKYYDMERFEKARDTVLQSIESEITDHEQAIDNLLAKQQEVNDLSPEDI